MKNKLIQIQGTQSKHINRVKLLSGKKDVGPTVDNH